MKEAERMGRMEADIEWIKNKLNRIDTKLDEIQKDQSSLKLKVAALSSSISIIVTLLLQYLGK